MKRRFFGISSLLFLLMVLAACGQASSNTGRNRGESPMPSGTMGTTTGDTGMTTVQVTETEYTIHASVTSFTPGTTYHFAVKNEGKITHEFMIMPKAEGAMKGMSMGKVDHLALAMIDTLNPGETKTFTYTFSAQASGSHPEFACYLPGHYEAGMKLGVTVKA